MADYLNTDGKVSSHEKIYSKVDPSVLLHIISRKNDINVQRENLSPDKEFLQLSRLKLGKGVTFKPHKHIKLVRSTDITQESWIVIQGVVKAMLYDLDDTLIQEVILKQGDCSITFRGGHTYEALEEDTIAYEYKTGPYFGQEKDKAFI